MEVLVIKEVFVEVLLHLVELIAANGVNIWSIELLLQNLGDSDLTQIVSHTEHVSAQDPCVLIILQLSWEHRFDFLFGWVLLCCLRIVITVLSCAHFT